MAMRKKGVIFTMMAIIMVTLVLFAIRPQMISHTERRIPVIENRVDVANSHLAYLENVYIERVLRYCSFKALGAYVAYLNRRYADAAYSPTNMSEVNDQFYQVLTSSSVNGECLNCSYYGIYTLENDTLNDKLREFSQLSKEFLNINVSTRVNSLSLFQSNTTGPWRVGVKLNTSIEVNSTIASWNITEYNTTSIFSIVGLEDWFYTYNSWKMTGVPHRKYIIDMNITRWNLEALKNYISIGGYKHEPLAPSFLSRFINQSSNKSSCCGIETIIGRDWASYLNMSFIDYCYFSRLCNGSNPGGYYRVYLVTNLSNTDYPFKIEPYHYSKERYNLTYKNATYPMGILTPD